jgi:hypothetical protein
MPVPGGDIGSSAGAKGFGANLLGPNVPRVGPSLRAKYASKTVASPAASAFCHCLAGRLSNKPTSGRCNDAEAPCGAPAVSANDVTNDDHEAD